MSKPNQHSDPFVALLHLRKTDCDGCNGAADCIVSLVEQVEALHREQTVLDGESVRLNRENRELKEQYEDALRQGLIIKERVNELEEQLEAAQSALRWIEGEAESGMRDGVLRVAALTRIRDSARSVLYPASDLIYSTKATLTDLNTGETQELDVTFRAVPDPASREVTIHERPDLFTEKERQHWGVDSNQDRDPATELKS